MLDTAFSSAKASIISVFVTRCVVILRCNTAFAV